MSKKAVYNALTRAFLDPNFRRELIDDTRGTVQRLGEDLTPEEEREIRSALEEVGGGSATGLDKRLSQSGVSISPQAMLRQKARTEKKGLRVEDLRFEGKKSKGKIQNGKKSGALQEEETLRANVEEYDTDEPDYEVERG